MSDSVAYTLGKLENAVEGLEKGLEAHTEQDARNFAAIDVKLNALTLESATRKVVLVSAAKWGAIFATLLGGAIQVTVASLLK